MQNWFLWAGISFVLGGFISFALNAGASETVSFQEDISGYAIGWILVGVVLISVGFIKKKK